MTGFEYIALGYLSLIVAAGYKPDNKIMEVTFTILGIFWIGRSLWGELS